MSRLIELPEMRVKNRTNMGAMWSANFNKLKSIKYSDATRYLYLDDHRRRSFRRATSRLLACWASTRLEARLLPQGPAIRCVAGLSLRSAAPVAMRWRQTGKDRGWLECLVEKREV